MANKIFFYMEADAIKATDKISFTDLNGDKVDLILYCREFKLIFKRNNEERVYGTRNSSIFTETLLERYALMLSFQTQKHGFEYEKYAKLEMQHTCSIEEMKIINSVVLEAV